MKALSIKQPWASLIAHGIKDIENRTWRTHFRGRIYIHASAPKKFNIQLSDEQTKKALPVLQTALEGTMPFGAIIGEVDIIDCVLNHPSIWADKTPIEPIKEDFTYTFDQPNGAETFDGDSYDMAMDAFKNQKPIYNWVLANPVLYEKPILNVKGKLSFWDPDTDIVECIGCSQKFDSEIMEVDDANEKYCPECWEHFEPILAQEAKEIRESEL